METTIKRNCERALMASSLILLLTGCGDNDKSSNPTPDAGNDASTVSKDSGTDAAPACEALQAPDGSAECQQDGQVLAIVGDYVDEFAFSWSIGSCSINGDAIATFSNSEHFFVAQNSCSAMFNPGKWSRYEWTWFSGDGGAPSLYFCTQVYDAETEGLALAAPRADATDPTTGGCGVGSTTFSWSKLNLPGTGDAGADAGDASTAH